MPERALPTQKTPLLLAMAEEDPILWYERAGITRRAARRAGAIEFSDREFSLTVTGENMRRATCSLHPNGLDHLVDDDDARDREFDRDGCECFYVDEGWHMVCAADHPAAIPVWRVEYGKPLLRYWWGRLTWRWRARRAVRYLHRPESSSLREAGLLIIPGQHGTFFLGDDAAEYRKTQTIRARQMNEPFVVKAMEGDHAGKPGDWLAQGSAGELWVIAHGRFEDTYEAAGADG